MEVGRILIWIFGGICVVPCHLASNLDPQLTVSELLNRLRQNETGFMQGLWDGCQGATEIETNCEQLNKDFTISTGERYPQLEWTNEVDDVRFDVVVVVTDSLDRLTGNLSFLRAPLEEYAEKDNATASEPVLVLSDQVPSGKIVLSTTGPLGRDYDDVRRFADAARKGIKRALKTGSRNPLLVRPRGGPFPRASLVAMLAALEEIYQPLELRETGCNTKADLLGVWITPGDERITNVGIPIILALESGRILARDIAASGPERMAPVKIEEYVRKAFLNTTVEMTVESDVDILNRDYPLFGAVNRAANSVERHRGRVIYLEYVGSGNITRTLFVVGKGVTFDTGGADLKVFGSMATMSRDKSGAGAVAGFMKVLSLLRPTNMRVIGAMPLVRNSIGEESYVADEIITSRSGVRVLVTNTDAEGRMIMADVLCRMKEMALDAVNPHIITIATLTGHALSTVGKGYTVVMDNGPALQKNMSNSLQATGEMYGDPFEVSKIRREDYGNHQTSNPNSPVRQTGKSKYRGHQGPASFLIMASGLDKHGKDSTQPLPYTHMDIAGSAKLSSPKAPAVPVIALSAHFLLEANQN